MAAGIPAGADTAPGHDSIPVTRRLRSVALPLAGYLAVTFVMLWPQWRQLSSVPEHHDAAFNIWRLAWIAHQIANSPLALFDANIFWPAGNTLALSDAVLFQGLLAAPLIWSGVPHAVAYNFVVLASYPALAGGTFLLVRRLTGVAPAAWIAGLIVAFAPFRADHYFHLEMLWACWVPLALWAFHRTLESGRLRDGVLTGGFVAAQALSCIYYAVFLATLLVVLAAALWGLRSFRLRSRAAAALLAGGLAGAVVVAPYGLPYARSAREIGARSAAETAVYSARPSSYATSPAASVLYGWTYFAWGGNERQLFMGLTGAVLMLAALWPPLDRRHAAYALCLVFLIDLSFGTHGVSFGLLRAVVPVYEGLRAPARAGMLAVIVLGGLAGIGVARLWMAAARRRGPHAQALLVVAATVAVLAESAWHMPHLAPVAAKAPPLAAWLRDQEPGPILHLPVPRPDRLPGHEPALALASRFHWRPLINGYSGAYPRAYLAFLERMRGFPDERAMAAIQASGATFAILHERYAGSAAFVDLDNRLRRHPALEHATWTMDESGIVSVYRVRRAR